MRFDNLPGNDRAKQQLNALDASGHMPHALILEGPKGSGTEELARRIAQWAVCASEGERPCGTCAACRKFLSGGHPDVFVAQGGSGSRSFHVDAVRAIRSDAYILPNEAQRKVYLLLGADTMTEQAQNALLKVLEEPPQRVLFVLTCASASSLLSTVRSRAQIISLHTSDRAGEEDSPFRQLAEEMARAAAATREYELLSLTGQLVKDKERMRETLKYLQLILRDACVKASGGSAMRCESEAVQSLRHFSRERLVSMLEVVRKAAAMVEQNANQNLLATWLCAGLRSC